MIDVSRQRNFQKSITYSNLYFHSIQFLMSKNKDWLFLSLYCNFVDCSVLVVRF
eukprot:UN14212